VLDGEQVVRQRVSMHRELMAFCNQNFMIGPDVPAMNENAISNVLVDTEFLEGELTRIGRGHLSSVFAELHSVKTYPPSFLAWLTLQML
jgi:hypothetical protein